MKLKQFMANSAIGFAMLAASATPILAAGLQQDGGTDIFLPFVSENTSSNTQTQTIEQAAKAPPIDDFEPGPPQGPSTPTPTPTPSGSTGGDYIVVFKESGGENERRLSTQQLANQVATQYGGTISHVYDSALDGFAATFSGDISAIASLSYVDFVVTDQLVETSTIQLPVSSWGLDRIDQRNRPLSNSYAYDENTDGTGIHVYVIDTGIRASHTDLGGRVSGGTSVVDGTTDDCSGHGTHVAGTIGGEEYGVAKGVALHPVKVFPGCGGSTATSNIIAGVDWVTNNRVNPAVVNMSLGGPNNPAMDLAVENSINSGIVYVVAAGNDDNNACSKSPARVGAALTIGSSTDKDKRASTSNYGSCVDLFAPGKDIVSAGIANNTAEATLSGTSMAAPHVAGAAALFLDANPNAPVAAVNDFIINSVTPGQLSNIGSGSPNRLLFIDPPAETKCAGLTPTLVGTDGNDTLNGTNGIDIILARGGNDTINAKWGYDIICGGPGNDNINGGDGQDKIYGEEGNDTIDGGWKNDTIIGGAGNDTIYGDLGDDNISGGDGDDYIEGNNGRDMIDGGAGEDRLHGGWDRDIINGGLDNDYITGGLEDDTIRGNEGHDTIDGENGNDSIYGGDGNDTIRGGAKGDNLYGEAGNDRIYGEGGGDTINGGSGTDTCSGGAGNDSITGCP